MSLGKVLVTALLAVSACNQHGASSQAPGLEDFMDDTGAVRLGMTEDEVSRALGSRPAERNALGPPLVEAAWRMGGKVPGTVLGRFVGGPLVYIKFTASLGGTPLPRVTASQVQQLTSAEVAIEAVRKELTLRKVLAVTGSPGRRLSWEIGRRIEDNTLGEQVGDTWVWEVEPGGRLLIVSKMGDDVGQPFIRELRSR